MRRIRNERWRPGRELFKQTSTAILWLWLHRGRFGAFCQAQKLVPRVAWDRTGRSVQGIALLRQIQGIARAELVATGTPGLSRRLTSLLPPGLSRRQRDPRCPFPPRGGVGGNGDPQCPFPPRGASDITSHITSGPSAAEGP